MAETSPWVAIVDDDASVLKALARLLRVRGLEVRTYTSARDFLAALHDGLLPECLILDLQMPETNGLELQHQLILNRVHIPTIIITANNEPGTRDRCRAAGAMAFLTKPLQETLLFTAIEEARGALRDDVRI
jgi:FixJ family two-component response regulator